jgi:serine/threonine protein kinase
VSQFVFEIGRGLYTLHKYYMVHRDVKPVNIFITNDGSYKIGVFIFLSIFIFITVSIYFLYQTILECGLDTIGAFSNTNQGKTYAEIQLFIIYYYYYY